MLGCTIAGPCRRNACRLHVPTFHAAIPPSYQVLDLLEPVKTDYPDISYADLIVMAGSTALKLGGNVSLEFCEGRVDATEGNELISVLEPRDYDDVIAGVRDRMNISGLSLPHFVALAGRPRSPSQMVRLNYSGSYTEDPTTVSNAFYNILLNETWEEVEDSGGAEYEAEGKTGVYVLATDLALVRDSDFKAQVVLYAENNELFLNDFASAWTTLMNADRFDGPFDNLCYDTHLAYDLANSVPYKGHMASNMIGGFVWLSVVVSTYFELFVGWAEGYPN